MHFDGPVENVFVVASSDNSPVMTLPLQCRAYRIPHRHDVVIIPPMAL